MDYQLVLQFEGDSLEILDSIVELEDNLIEALDDIAEVDGHDVGSGEANIYIFTSDPSVAFQRIRPLLEHIKSPKLLAVAYRESDGENYTTLWPSGTEAKFSIK